MSHHPQCIRSDGDWICVAACTHDHDKARADEINRLVARAETAEIQLVKERKPSWICVYDDAFDSALCERLRTSMLTAPTVTRVNTDWQRCDKLEMSTGSTLWIDARRALADVFERYKRDVLHNGNLNFCTHVEVPNIVRYRADSPADRPDYFHLHADNWNAESALRQVSIVVSLNTTAKSGDTVFPHLGCRFAQISGRALIFPSSFQYLHMAEPTVDEDKYVLVSWYCYEPRTRGHYTAVALR